MPDLFNRWAFTVWSKRKPKLSTETYKLQFKAEHLFRASKLSQEEPEWVAVGLTHEIEKNFGVALPLPVSISLSIAISDLMLEAGIYLPEYALEGLNPLSSTAKHIRNRFREQIRFYQDETESSRVFGEVIEAVFSHVLGRLAENPSYEAALASSTLADDGLSLRLLDYLGNTTETVDGMVRVFFARELIHHGMFTQFREYLASKVRQSAGGSGSRQSTEKVIWPSDANFADPEDLVDHYLGGTALDTLLTTRLPATLPEHARFEHCHIVGGSGHGKTQLLSQLIMRDIEKAEADKRSLIVMDSQGDLISKILSLAAIHDGPLKDRLVIIDPNEFEEPIALNPFTLSEERLESYQSADRERVLHGAIDLFEHFLGELLGTELTAQQGTAFKFLVRLMVSIPDATLLTFRDLMDRPQNFKSYMEALPGSARMFFEREFLSSSYNQTRRQISKRLWAILSNPVFERLFSSPLNKVDWFSLMQDGHIILINTAKDFLKTDGSALFGRFLNAQIAQGILERATLPEEDRTPTFFYIDEAHEYVDQTTELLLSQGRKYRLGLTMAHQHLDQLSTSQRSSLLSNTSIKLAGGLNRKDAQTLSGEMACDPAFLQSMRKKRDETQFALSVRHLISPAATLTVPFGHMERQPQAAWVDVQMALEVNRERYGRPWIQEEYQTPSKEPEPKAIEPTIAAKKEPTPVKPKPLAAPPPPPPSVLLESDQEGQGGPDHVYLQNLVKGLAEDAGYRAEIEASVTGGSVDVLLKRKRTLIAVEIGLSTPPDHEVGNIQKGYMAGAQSVWMIAKTKKRLRSLERTAQASLSKDQLEKTRFLLPEDLPALLLPEAEPEATEQTVKGYKVRVQASSQSEANQRRAAIAQVIAKSLSQK